MISNHELSSVASMTSIAPWAMIRLTPAGILLPMVLLLSLVSCGGVEGDDVALQLVTSDLTENPAGLPAGFDEEDCMVLRCASTETTGNELLLVSSKSKDMEASTLVFVLPTQPGNQGSYSEIAIVPVTGKEYEYDLTKVVMYHVTTSAADAATAAYGIPYPDWLMGAYNNSEKFPCCE